MSSQERRSWPARPRVRRRQTLPSLPATPTDEDETKQQQQQQQQRDSWKKHSRVPSLSAAVSDQHDPSHTSSARSRRLGARLSGDGQTTSHSATSASAFIDTRGPHRRLGRTPSSPSVLLSKVKERIREKVFETSAEWPHLAAVERERRQRAALAFEQSLRCGNVALARQTSRGRLHQPVTSRHPGRLHASDDVLNSSGQERPGSDDKLRRLRLRSDPSRRSCPTDVTDVPTVEMAVRSFDKAAARLAFRRRSISEDTYNRSSQLHRNVDEDDSGSGTLTADPSKRAVGVVCSDEDLKAIVHLHKRRQSPTVSPTTEYETAAPSLFSAMPEDVEDRTVSFTVAAAVDRADTHGVSLVDTGSGASLTQPSTSSTSFAESESTSCESSAAGPAAALPMSVGITVLAGFTPTVASITEQMSLEIIESSDVNGTPPRTSKLASTVPDVVYDEHGQTWDVYGAEFDPVILGQAIQSYLEKIMARKAQAATRNVEQRTTSSEKLTVEEAASKEDVRCQSLGRGRDSPRSSQMDRALSFVMRYLCTRAWRHGHTAT